MVKPKDKGALPPTYESGIVEVVFKEDVRIRAVEVPARAKKPWNLVSKAKIDIKSLDDFLRKIKCTGVVKTFTAQSEKEYQLWQRQNDQNGL